MGPGTEVNSRGVEPVPMQVNADRIRRIASPFSFRLGCRRKGKVTFFMRDAGVDLYEEWFAIALRSIVLL